MSSDWSLTGRLGRSRALNYLKPAGVLTERLRPIRAQFFSTVTQRRHDSRCSEFNVAPQQIKRRSSDCCCSEWHLNWIQVSEWNLRRKIWMFQFSFIVSEQKRNIKNLMFHTHDNQLLFFTSRQKWTCWLDTTKHYPADSVFFWCHQKLVTSLTVE